MEIMPAQTVAPITLYAARTVRESSAGKTAGDSGMKNKSRLIKIICEPICTDTRGARHEEFQISRFLY